MIATRGVAGDLPITTRGVSMRGISGDASTTATVVLLRIAICRRLRSAETVCKARRRVGERRDDIP